MTDHSDKKRVDRLEGQKTVTESPERHKVRIKMGACAKHGILATVMEGYGTIGNYRNKRRRLTPIRPLLLPDVVLSQISKLQDFHHCSCYIVTILLYVECLLRTHPQLLRSAATTASMVP